MSAPTSGALRADDTACEAIAILLGPERGAANHPVRRYAVLPSPRRPRYLLPTIGRAGAGASLRPGSGRKAAAARWVVRGMLRTGTTRALPGSVEVVDGTAADPGLRRHLGHLLGRDDLDLAVALGAPRPNRKPVIQVLAADATTVAWAKLGVDAHTDGLVSHEARALAVPRSDPLIIPEVVATSTWHRHPLLVLAPMDLTEAPGDLELTVPALVALAGAVHDEPATSSAWWRDLRRRAAKGVDPSGAVRTRLDLLAARLGSRSWSFGRWHGDLAPWNATWEDGRLKVWDWERAGGPVPVGLDAVHNHLQVAMLRDGRDLTSALASAPATVGDLLVGLGHSPDDVDLVVEAYLAVLRVRYADDAHLGSLGPGAAVAAALDAQVARSRTGTP